MATRVWTGAAGDNDWDTAGNWLNNQVPGNGDAVIVPAMAADSTKDIAGEDKSSVLLTGFYVEPGCYLKIGSRTAPLELDADYVVYQGLGDYSFLDLANATRIEILDCGAGGDEAYGLNLSGSSSGADVFVNVDSGRMVGIGAFEDAGWTGTDLHVLNGQVDIGDDLALSGTLHLSGGDVQLRDETERVAMSAGTLTLAPNGNIGTSLNLRGGLFKWQAGGTIAALNISGGGVVDASASGDAKTISVLTWYGEGHIIDPLKTITISAITFQVGGNLAFA